MMIHPATKNQFTPFSLVCALLLAIGVCTPLRAMDSLEQDFCSPPPEAKNWVFWMWLRTPTTPAAMTRDLEEMKAKGISGFILYDCGANAGTPLPLVRPWSPEWRKSVRYVAAEARRLGLKFCLSVGMGGVTAPNLDPQYSDQELKWTIQEVTGPMKFEGVIPLPDKSNASNKDGSPMFWDVRVLAVPLDSRSPAQVTEILDLSSKMDGSGKLSWEVPSGKWRITRFIQRPINKIEGWGARVATYCDVLSTSGIEQSWALTMKPLLEEMTPEERSGLIALEDDSYEGGGGSWTKSLPREFLKRRGYDLMKYLPVLSGETITDAITTERVKRDYQQTIIEMGVDNYFGRLQELCKENGFAFHSEANWRGGYHSNAYQWTVRKVDLPMSEFWMPGDMSNREHQNFTREAASAAHLYGRNILMAEAFTSVGPQWEETPFYLKAAVDRAYCDGLNRVCIHNYSHSPLLDGKPGHVYYAGTHINRNITWWDEAPAFFKYMERCQAMLQNGRFTADALWLSGDGLVGAWMKKNQVLAGYDYDRISNDNLIEMASVKDGQIVIPSGLKYRVLIMPSGKMTLKALEKIESLAQAGAMIVGGRPAGMAGLPLHEKDERKYDELLVKLWGDSAKGTSETTTGAGRVISGKSPEQVLREMGISPDFEHAGLSASGTVSWIHRQSDDAAWYFVASRSVSPEKLICKFRVTGKQPELWDPVTGEMREATAFKQENGQTVVPLEFDPSGSIFVVFRKTIDSKMAGTTASNSPKMELLSKLDGSWTVAFDPKWGGPAEPVVFNSLVDWSTHTEDGIKYYSGSAVYTKTFDMPAAIPAGRRLMLDLGDVREIASIKLNGNDLGVIWMRPARVDITHALKPTGNQLEIKIVNLWPNRLIGDEFLSPEQRFTKTNMRIRFKRNSPLLPSGLLGPVVILAR